MGDRACRRISCNSSYVNKRGSDDGLYGLKSMMRGWEC
jgi:hypothetical protein